MVNKLKSSDIFRIFAATVGVVLLAFVLTLFFSRPSTNESESITYAAKYNLTSKGQSLLYFETESEIRLNKTIEPISQSPKTKVFIINESEISDENLSVDFANSSVSFRDLEFEEFIAQSQDAGLSSPKIMYGLVSNSVRDIAESGVVLLYSNNGVLFDVSPINSDGVWSFDFSSIKNKQVKLVARTDLGLGNLEISLEVLNDNQEVVGLVVGDLVENEFDYSSSEFSFTFTSAGVAAERDSSGGAVRRSCQELRTTASSSPVNIRGGWAKACLQPFDNEQGETILHEFVELCSSSGEVVRSYSQLNPNCTAARVGLSTANSLLNDACTTGGLEAPHKSSPGGCAGLPSIGGPAAGDSSSSSGSPGSGSGSNDTGTDTTPDNTSGADTASETPDTTQTVDIPIAANVISANLMTAIDNSQCFLNDSDQAKIAVYQWWDGRTFSNNGQVGSHHTYVPNQKATDVMSRQNNPNEYSNIEVRSPVRGRVVEVRTPIQTALIFGINRIEGGDIVQGINSDFCDERKDSSGRLFYDGGFTVHIRRCLTEACGDNDLGELYKLNHVENIRVAEDSLITAGTVVGNPFDGTINAPNDQALIADYIRTNIPNFRIESGKSAYEYFNDTAGNMGTGSTVGGCFTNVIAHKHIHFAIISASAVENNPERPPLQSEASGFQTSFFAGNDINSSYWLVAKCQQIFSDYPSNYIIPDNVRSFRDQIQTSSLNLDKFQSLKPTVAAEIGIIGDRTETSPTSPLASTNPSVNITPPSPGSYEILVNGQNASGQTVEILNNNVELLFFRDVNGDGIRQENEPYISQEELGQNEVVFNKKKEAVRFELNRGWNALALPGSISGVTTASQLFDKITAALGGRATSFDIGIAALTSPTNYAMYRKIKSNSADIGSTVVESGIDFRLSPQMGIFIYSSQNINFHLVLNEEISAEYKPWKGYNFIAIGSRSDGMTYSEYIQQNSSFAGFDLKSVSEYTNSRFQTVVVDDSEILGDSQRSMSKYKGYFVLLD